MPKTSNKGKRNHPINTTNPKIKIKTSTMIPIRIKIVLITAPKSLEIKFETNTLRYLAISSPLPYDQAYLFQCEKKVFSNNGMEK